LLVKAATTIESDEGLSIFYRYSGEYLHAVFDTPTGNRFFERMISEETINALKICCRVKKPA